MNIKKTLPPNYEQIAKRFNIKNDKGLVFTYGDTIYNPSGNEIVDHLMVHEVTHMDQQRAIGVSEWWTKYLEDDNFRFEQELQAYQAQYKHICTTHNRQGRRAMLIKLAKDLSGHIYGNLATKEEAKELIAG